MMQAPFGLFDWMDRGEAPLGRQYQERLRLLEAADAAGFFCYHLAEHHATPLGLAPSPALFLAAAAQRTRRIRLGVHRRAPRRHRPSDGTRQGQSPGPAIRRGGRSG